jgi:hypothetical protein
LRSVGSMGRSLGKNVIAWPFRKTVSDMANPGYQPRVLVADEPTGEPGGATGDTS